MNRQPDPFYRPASRPLAPVNHIVAITAPNGAQYFRRVSLTALQMSQLERQLMQLQHSGDISAYMITAADDATFHELTVWADSLKYHPEQPALLSTQQNSLFGGTS